LSARLSIRVTVSSGRGVQRELAIAGLLRAVPDQSTPRPVALSMYRMIETMDINAIAKVDHAPLRRINALIARGRVKCVETPIELGHNLGTSQFRVDPASVSG